TYNLSVPSDPIFGAQTAISMAVAPGRPHTIAAIVGSFNWSPPNTGGTFIYDDVTARTSSIPYYVEGSTSLVWGNNASALYATDNNTGADLFVNTVNSTGVTLADDYGGVMLPRTVPSTSTRSAKTSIRTTATSSTRRAATLSVPST